MSYSLAIENGDLATNTNTMGTVGGVNKLIQDLSMWLREQYQIDRFHPDYGSVFQNYIGDIIGDLQLHELQVEALRVLSIYQQVQLMNLKNNPGKFTLDELLDSVDNIDITPSYDRVYINISFTTASGLLGVVSGEVSV